MVRTTEPRNRPAPATRSARPPPHSRIRRLPSARAPSPRIRRNAARRWLPAGLDSAARSSGSGLSAALGAWPSAHDADGPEFVNGRRRHQDGRGLIVSSQAIMSLVEAELIERGLLFFLSLFGESTLDGRTSLIWSVLGRQRERCEQPIMKRLR